ncbi:unnamed protein product, partial [marine sediment metagenome]
QYAVIIFIKEFTKTKIRKIKKKKSSFAKIA